MKKGFGFLLALLCVALLGVSEVKAQCAVSGFAFGFSRPAVVVSNGFAFNRGFNRAVVVGNNAVVVRNRGVNVAVGNRGANAVIVNQGGLFGRRTNVIVAGQNGAAAFQFRR